MLISPNDSHIKIHYETREYSMKPVFSGSSGSKEKVFFRA